MEPGSAVSSSTDMRILSCFRSRYDVCLDSRQPVSSTSLEHVVRLFLAHFEVLDLSSVSISIKV